MTTIQYQIIVMFAIMAVGYLCGKTKIITKDVNRGLSSLSLYVVNPLVTFCSYQREYTREIAENLGGTFLVAVAAFAVQIVLSLVFLRRKNAESSIERLSVMLSNCSYIGIPLVQSVYGGEGVIYLTAYVTVFHLVTWTYGVYLMSGETSIKKAARNFVSPVIIAVAAGLVCFFGKITIPDIVFQPMSQLGDMNTPLAMLIAGSNL
ncbi:MAG: AEC family transporter, partial [Clostridia bacterium]|nr:AEC family transporter [Clostridia bacterium]